MSNIRQNIFKMDELSDDKRKEICENAYMFEVLEGKKVYLDVGAEARGIKFVKFGAMDEEEDKEPWMDNFREWYWENHGKITKLPEYIYLGMFLIDAEKYKPEYVNNFFLVDAYDKEACRFVDYDDVFSSITQENVDIRTIPVFHKGTITDDIYQQINTTSPLSKTGKTNGIIIKNYKEQLFAIV